MKEKKKSNRKMAKILVFSLLTVLIIIALLIGTIYWYISSRINKIDYVEINKEEIEINEGIDEKLYSYRNIAIFGVDTYEEKYEVSGRSDCIMIATLNEKTNEVKLTSIYRDTYVEISGRGLDKINHAYAFGGPVLALSTINANLDLNITEFVVVNFDSVINSVDALGGIEMEITSEEVKYINGYIKSLIKNTGIESELITTPGVYLLDGVQALSYSRIRYTEGWDYKRTERMRTVLSKMLEKAKTLDRMQLLKVLDETLPIITTNVDKDEIIPTVLDINKYKVANSVGWPYDVRGYTGAAWYGAPVTLKSNVTRLHKDIFEEENYIPTEKVQEISGRIENKTSYSN